MAPPDQAPPPPEGGPRRRVPCGSPTRLLEFLGIDTPADIDVEAIAQACGATVIYQPLSGCEARLVGASGRAIIAVDEAAPLPRRRFSAAHELGHWVYDRGRQAFACDEEQLVGEWGQANVERRANRFAADLLLPRPLFKRRTRHRPMTFAAVRELAREFVTSLTATAIRLVELGSYPAMVVCCDGRGMRRWFAANHHLPPTLVPHLRLPGPPAGEPLPRRMRGDRLIAHPLAARHDVAHDVQVVAKDHVLHLIWWTDEPQLQGLSDTSEPMSEDPADEA